MLLVDRSVEVCLSPDRKTCCGGAVERRLHQVAVEEAHDVVSSATLSLRTLVADNAVHYQRKLLTLPPSPEKYKGVCIARILKHLLKRSTLFQTINYNPSHCLNIHSLTAKEICQLLS